MPTTALPRSTTINDEKRSAPWGVEAPGLCAHPLLPPVLETFGPDGKKLFDGEGLIRCRLLREVFQHENVILAVVGLISGNGARVVISLAPADSMRLTTHHLALTTTNRSTQSRVDGGKWNRCQELRYVPSVGLFDFGCVVLVMRAQSECIGDQCTKVCPFQLIVRWIDCINRYKSYRDPDKHEPHDCRCDQRSTGGRSTRVNACAACACCRSSHYIS